MPNIILPVLVPLPFAAGPLDYLPPSDGPAPRPGDFVSVPLGQRHVIGVVWDRAAAGAAPAGKLKPVAGILPAPAMTAPLRKLIDWVANYTVSPPGLVLKMAMSAPDALRPMKRPRPEKPAPQPDAHHPGPVLSPDQTTAAADLRARLGRFDVCLLEGVTGSGKTEVYFEAIAAALQSAFSAQILVLVPEIALTAQWLGRFAARFGAEPAMWHSDLTPAARRKTWTGVARGEARVVVGARSALFLPFADLRLIVADEEHDSAFKQEDGVIYHARDMAVVRARLTGCPIILASATPSLETVQNVRAGRYGHVQLAARHGGAALPAMTALDLRADPPERNNWLAPGLVRALNETFAAGEQALLFLNRRGYAPLTLCRTCGHRMECPNCSAWMVEHRGHYSRLQCHHCGTQIARPKACPACGAEDSLVAIGPGVERVAEEAAMRFPQARQAVVSSDTLTSPLKMGELARAVEAREIDLLIGTQILTKGHHFPALTLVGVVDADLGLDGADPRAGERLFQQLSQAAGRAGRGALPGRVFLQTFQPEHPVLAALAAGDAEGFVARELDMRRRAGMPPFGRLAALILSGEKEAQVAECARRLARAAPPGFRDLGLEIYGPAPAPMALLRGKYRYRLLLKSRDGRVLSHLARDWAARVSLPRSVRLAIDIDPQSFM